MYACFFVQGWATESRNILLLDDEADETRGPETYMLGVNIKSHS